MAERSACARPATRRPRLAVALRVALLGGGLLAGPLGSVLPAALTPARAQTASQITPPSFAPAQQNRDGGLGLREERRLGLPAGADRPRLRVRRGQRLPVPAGR